jgi:hypothetical protein
MNRILTGTVGAMILSLAGFTAHAGCADPRIVQREPLPQMAPLNLNLASAPNLNPGGDGIIGTWSVMYTANGATSPYGVAFIQWHSDHTEWENITMPVLNGNICMGSWKTIDPSHVYRNHVGWLFDTGTISGYFTETETDEVAHDGNSYHGHNVTIGYDLSGNKLFEVNGTSVATRIAP